MPKTDESDSALRAYFDDISASKPLSREHEVGLAARIQQGDMEARDKLVQANLRFVVDVAKEYQNRGLPLSDLISAGNLGLMTAAERFDGTKGFKFISYAVWWIKQSIKQTLAEHVRTVRLPLNKLGLLHDISMATRALEKRTGEPPSLEAIAAELDLPIADIEGALLESRQPRSLDEPLDDDSPRNLLNLLATDEKDSPEANMLVNSAKGELAEILKSLDEREAKIIRLYFGLDGIEALTLEQIGSLMHLTRERIRQLKERALGKLRHPSRSGVIRSLYDPDYEPPQLVARKPTTAAAVNGPPTNGHCQPDTSVAAVQPPDKKQRTAKLLIASPAQVMRILDAYHSLLRELRELGEPPTVAEVAFQSGESETLVTKVLRDSGLIT